MRQAAVGFRVHSGWAAAVTLAGERKSPAVVDRRRIVLADGSPGSQQPYHAAEKLPLPAAEALIGRCRQSTLTLARLELDDIRRAHPVDAFGIPVASGRPLPELAAILASHAMIHAAEGEFFRQAVAETGRECGLAVRTVKERELAAVCAAELRLTPDRLNQQLADWGRKLGPPWRQDEKFAALVAWLALAS